MSPQVLTGQGDEVSGKRLVAFVKMGGCSIKSGYPLRSGHRGDRVKLLGEPARCRIEVPFSLYYKGRGVKI